MVLQIVSHDVLARIQAMQDSGRVISLATPNLCVADGEASRIFVGKETTILTSVTVNKSTTTGNNPVIDTSYDPVSERMNIGTTLLITPRIHADRTTTIRIVQEDSQVGDTQEIVFGTDHSGSVLNSSNMSFFTKDIDNRTVTTTVVASDGQVSAIGGLIREEVKQRDIGVPGLMKIPYLGMAFKTSFKKRERHELLILVRPFVLLAPGENNNVTQCFMKQLSEHPSAHGMIPPLRIGDGSFNVINERIYEFPKEAFQAVKQQAVPLPTECP
jgi:general secretion pathway protein D